MKFKLPRRSYLPLSLLFWVGIWWLVAVILDNTVLFPTPSVICTTLLGMMKTSAFWLTLVLSLLRILFGIVLALIAGVALALLTVKVPFLHHLFSPLLLLFKATPVASVIFLILLWIGRNNVSIFIAFIMALPIVWSNVREGLLQTDRKLLEMAQVFGLSKKEQLLSIRIPSLLPYFLAACRSAISLAWKAGIAAEVICTPQNSIGTAIYEGKLDLFFRDESFAWTLVTILISALIEWGAVALLNKAQGMKQREAKSNDKA